jgi:hypothetical protein
MINFNNILEYKDGDLYWKNLPKNATKVKVGDQAGKISHSGYRVIGISGKYYMAHRVIFHMFNNYTPKNVDHIDCNKLNNRIENLREATPSQNNCNTPARKRNATGVKNVSWDKTRNSYRVQIQFQNKKRSIGHFKDFELADLVAQEARAKYHGEYAYGGAR